MSHREQAENEIMKTSNTINRIAIMQKGWTNYRRFNSGPFSRRHSGEELPRAWSKAKLAAYKACPINRARAAIAEVENKSKFTQADYACLGVLRAALRAHQEAAAASPISLTKAKRQAAPVLPSARAA